MRVLRKTLVSSLPWIALLALLFAAMTPGLKGPFFFDDGPNIVTNTSIQIKDLSLAALKSSIEGPDAGPLGRPVSVLSFALTYYFFDLDPTAFRAVNVIIHAMNGMLVAWLVTLLLQMLHTVQLPQKVNYWLPLWVAACWLIHPINFVPVMLVVQRMTLLSGMFTLLALISHLKAVLTPTGQNTKWAWLAAGWLLFWPLSILSKETGLLFPLYILAITLIFPSTSGIARQNKRWVAPVSLISLLLAAAAMLSFLGPGWLDSAYAMRPFTLVERVLTEARVLWFYVAQTTVPNYESFGLYLDDFTLSTGILSPATTLIAIVGWVSVMVGILYFRRRQPLLSFAAAWFIAGHSLESTFLPLEIAHEYRNYIPSIGLIFGSGYLGLTILQKIRLDHRSLTISVTAVVPLVVLLLFTWMRADQMKDPLVGSQIEASRHPHSARANYNAALTLIQAGFGDAGDPFGGQQVRFYMQQAEAVDPSFKFGSLSLIVWACASGRPIEKQWIDTFARRLRNTPFSPSDKELPDHLLKPLIELPKCLERQQAIALFEAGADNLKAGKQVRAKFLVAASDYELLVSLDPRSARDYLARASAIFPEDPSLKQKVHNFTFLKLATDHSKE